MNHRVTNPSVGQRDQFGFLAAVLPFVIAVTTTSAAAVDDAPGTAQSSTNDAVTIRGSGQDRELLIRGRVFDATGQPASGYELLISHWRYPSGHHALTPEIDDAEFAVWVPIGGPADSRIDVTAITPDGQRRTFHGVFNWSFRQAAVDGIDLMLEPTNREVEIAVSHNGRPVSQAHVTAALTSGELMHGETNTDGVAVFHLMNRDAFQQLTAWTDDFQIGGHFFGNKPWRNPFSSRFTIELDDCRNQMIRLVSAEDNRPVPHIGVSLTVGSGPPNYQCSATPDTLPQCRMITDENGEAIYRLFPNGERHRSYVVINAPDWIRAGANELTTEDDGAIIMRVKRRAERRPLVGHVTSDDSDVGGLLVTVSSHQGEEKGFSDVLHAVTDSDGRFTVDCLPGATYCVYVADDYYVSDSIDLIPYEPSTGESLEVELRVTAGQPVKIRLTSGTDNQPIANQQIDLRTHHSYSWLEAGEKKNGVGARYWHVRTDENGIAKTRAMSGSELNASVYAGEWRSGDHTVTIESDGVTTLRIHREITREREVTGRLIVPPGVDTDLANAEIIFGAVDGVTDERLTGRSDQDGQFSFATKALDFGVFAQTADGTASGIAVSDNANQSLDVILKPTADLRGQVLEADDMPLVGHSVRVTPRVEGRHAQNKLYSTSFNAMTFETKTDDDGHYVLENLPSELDLMLRADPIDGSQFDARLGRFRLEAGESRTDVINRMDHHRSVGERYAGLLADAARGDFHLIVLIFDAPADEFVNAMLTDSEAELDDYIKLLIREDEFGTAAGFKLLKEHDWPIPRDRTVFACVLDGSGQEIGRIELMVGDFGAADEAAEFIYQHAPPVKNTDEE